MKDKSVNQKYEFIKKKYCEFNDEVYKKGSSTYELLDKDIIEIIKLKSIDFLNLIRTN